MPELYDAHAAYQIVVSDGGVERIMYKKLNPDTMQHYYSQHHGYELSGDGQKQ